ncbi:MAG: hypothetical protein UY50_C0038G0003 [Parcubacteria group bacterium GW2011_GWA2_49_9]|nr:MAG: hypothetical protein UY50_C0038G0003 [Parcubacteria group bacterium GW2011_GWA2_49_9]
MKKTYVPHAIRMSRGLHQGVYGQLDKARFELRRNQNRLESAPLSKRGRRDLEAEVAQQKAELKELNKKARQRQAALRRLPK